MPPTPSAVKQSTGQNHQTGNRTDDNRIEEHLKDSPEPCSVHWHEKRRHGRSVSFPSHFIGKYASGNTEMHGPADGKAADTANPGHGTHSIIPYKSQCLRQRIGMQYNQMPNTRQYKARKSQES